MDEYELPYGVEPSFERCNDGSGDIIVRVKLPRAVVEDRIAQREFLNGFLNDSYTNSSPLGNSLITDLVIIILKSIKEVAKRIGIVGVGTATILVSKRLISAILEGNIVALKNILKRMSMDRQYVYILVRCKFDGYSITGDGVIQYTPYRIEYEDAYGNSMKSGEFEYRPGSSYPTGY